MYLLLKKGFLKNWQLIKLRGVMVMLVTSKYYMWLSRFMEMNSDYLYCPKLLPVVLIISATFFYVQYSVHHGSIYQEITNRCHVTVLYFLNQDDGRPHDTVTVPEVAYVYHHSIYYCICS
jgi:hypothetical protein